LISTLFLDDINLDLDLFQHAHNNHSVSTEGGLLPLQLRFQGFVEHGVCGMWEEPGLHRLPGEAHEDMLGRELDLEELEALEEQVCGQVELENPHCLFIDDPRLAELNQHVENSRALPAVERWQVGVAKMEAMLAEDT
jgi:hypothetical protein